VYKSIYLLAYTRELITVLIILVLRCVMSDVVDFHLQSVTCGAVLFRVHGLHLSDTCVQTTASAHSAA